ncbi:MAG: hypothetical protein VR64_19535 [Desulfatitalea sp. BRH_c12]|nr:MAG: hypothetical protein VR64_19535 [Desulfatitalea sp. BRH_c12]
MNKVISLDAKLKISAEYKTAALRKQKIRAVRKMFQCTQCSSKCERCGTPVEAGSETVMGDTRIPYHFCAACAEEYLDYVRHLQGKGNPEAYWHNHHWLKVWQTWIEYQGAIDQYLRSKEFRRIMEELGPHDHPCDG